MSITGDIYGKRTLDFVERLQRLTDYEEICRHVNKELEWYGLSSVTIWSLPGPGEGLTDGFLLNNRPPEYVARYSEKNYVNLDPVVTELRKTTHPYSWNDVRERRDLSGAERTIIDEAREFEARNGFIVPILTLSGRMALFSPCGREPNLSKRARAALEMVGIYSYHALRRAVVEKKREVSAHTPLTPREREVMRWAAVGKTDDEIATILSIGRTTVITHVENAKRKLDTSRRIYAVVQAIRLGEITI